MRKLFSICLAALMSATMLAAETEFLPISVYAADNTETFPFGAKDMVENKLTQLLTRNGIAGMDYLGQFVLTVTATPLDKDIIPGPPAKIAEKMDLNLYIVDAYARTIFSATSLTVRGLGETENKCYLNAISRMPLQSEQVAKFVQEGKQKILDYYNHEAPALIKRANHLAKQRNYEEALNLVVQKKPESSLRSSCLTQGAMRRHRNCTTRLETKCWMTGNSNRCRNIRTLSNWKVSVSRRSVRSA